MRTASMLFALRHNANEVVEASNYTAPESSPLTQASLVGQNNISPISQFDSGDVCMYFWQHPTEDVLCTVFTSSDLPGSFGAQLAQSIGNRFTVLFGNSLEKITTSLTGTSKLLKTFTPELHAILRSMTGTCCCERIVTVLHELFNSGWVFVAYSPDVARQAQNAKHRKAPITGESGCCSKLFCCSGKRKKSVLPMSSFEFEGLPGPPANGASENQAPTNRKQSSASDVIKSASLLYFNPSVVDDELRELVIDTPRIVVTRGSTVGSMTGLALDPIQLESSSRLRHINRKFFAHEEESANIKSILAAIVQNSPAKKSASPTSQLPPFGFTLPPGKGSLVPTHVNVIQRGDLFIVFPISEEVRLQGSHQEFCELLGNQALKEEFRLANAVFECVYEQNVPLYLEV
eukprot:TRINITY_DN33266_c0_g1_i1.p1 TRINITY_DN33266_c0_g1~~TRINITY_DN33266_c0_g1_i1.p1  ORF type:complete len:447 (-),score=19.61 TRINITY_DN33266_c0_g1_i1:153-1364(-)